MCPVLALGPSSCKKISSKIILLNNMQSLLCIECGLISGFGLTYGVIDVAGVNGGVGLPGTGLC